MRPLQIILLLLLPLAATAHNEIFNYPNFDTDYSLARQGSSTYANGRANLTAGTNQSGGLWYPTKLFLSGGFETTFQFQLSQGSEGFALLLHNNPLPVLGRRGSGLGFEGIPNSLAIEFDPVSSSDILDRPGAHVSVQTRGAIPNNAYISGSIAFLTTPQLANGQVHTAKIRYVPGTLQVFLDNMDSPIISTSLNLENHLNLEHGLSWFGFVSGSSASGAAQILNWSMHKGESDFSVELASPLQGGSFTTPGVVEISAIARGPNDLQSLEFYNGSQQIFSTTNSSHTFLWDSLTPGPYTIYAVATDATGRKVTSTPASIIVYPSQPTIGVNFATGPDGTSYNLAGREKAGVIPQYFWNNAPLLPNGSGTLQNLRDASGKVTPIDIGFDFVARGQESAVDPSLSPDHKLMRSYGAMFPGTPQANSVIQIQNVPFNIYDVILYVDGANGGADEVSEIRAGGFSTFIRNAAGSTFAGTYQRAGGNADLGTSTPSGNYVRLIGITTPTIGITNVARSSTDNTPHSGITAIQIVPSIYDKNAPIFLTRGPYLQLGTTSSMIFRWRSNRPVTSRVNYGTDPLQLTNSVVLSAETQEHSVSVTNLQPNTRYYYSVGTSETNLLTGPQYHFWTSPASEKPTRLWVIGDSGTANANAAAVRDAFHQVNGDRYIDVWLLLGDNAYNTGTDAEYQAAVFNMYTNLLPQSPMWPTLGNHDTQLSHTYNPNSPYYSIYDLPIRGEAGGVPSGDERYYSFDYGNIHFVCLDTMTSERTPDSAMGRWLQADLEANTNKWLLVFFHHPPYTKGSHDSDNPGGTADFELVEVRENLLPILEAYGADLVMSGHSHCYERSYLLKGHYGYSSSLEPSMILNSGSGDPLSAEGPYRKVSDGTVYMVAGSSGQATFGTMDHPAHYKSLLNLGSVIIDIEGDTLNARYVRETAEIQDVFTIIKTPPNAPANGLQITSISTIEGILTVSWNSKAGTKYLVQKANQVTGPWETISEEFTAETTNSTWSAPSGMSNTAFFRVITVE